jgi:hypothetical protein
VTRGRAVSAAGRVEDPPDRVVELGPPLLGVGGLPIAPLVVPGLGNLQCAAGQRGRYAVLVPLGADEAGHGYFIASFTHRTTERLSGGALVPASAASAVASCFDHITNSSPVSTRVGTELADRLVVGQEVVSALGGNDNVQVVDGVTRVVACLDAGDDIFKQRTTAFSSNSIGVANSGHYIRKDQPDAVLEAIHSVAAAIPRDCNRDAWRRRERIHQQDRPSTTSI